MSLAAKQQWKPEVGVEREQTITHEEHIRSRLSSDHAFKGSDRHCDWCGRARRWHRLREDT